MGASRCALWGRDGALREQEGVHHCCSLWPEPGLASPGADNEQLRARPHQPDPRLGGSATVRLWATAVRPLGLSFLRCEWAMRAPPRVAVRDEPKPLQCGLAQSRGYSGHLCGVQKVPRRLGPALEEPRVQNSVAAEGPAHL